MFRLVLSLACLLTAGLPAGVASATVLYDASLGSLPSDQGWIHGTNPLPGSSSQSVVDGLYVLDSMADEDDHVGEFAKLGPLRHPNLPRLERDPGFLVSWTLRVDAEEHSRDERAGFSVIVLAVDRMGVELAFWEDEIWAQTDEPLFEHGEGVAFDTTAALVRYDLLVRFDTYTLHADGVPILIGPVKDYTAAVIEPVNPYLISNFIFFGDDTTSARARFEMGLFQACFNVGGIDLSDDLRLRREDDTVVATLTDSFLIAGYRLHRARLPAEVAAAEVFRSSEDPELVDDVSIGEGGLHVYLATAVDDCGFVHSSP
ncbi:MAG: hypothetical protein AAF533_05745 [Acidobacteriota bacterium]